MQQPAPQVTLYTLKKLAAQVSGETYRSLYDAYKAGDLVPFKMQGCSPRFTMENYFEYCRATVMRHAAACADRLTAACDAMNAEGLNRQDDKIAGVLPQASPALRTTPIGEQGARGRTADGKYETFTMGDIMRRNTAQRR